MNIRPNTCQQLVMTTLSNLSVLRFLLLSLLGLSLSLPSMAQIQNVGELEYAILQSRPKIGTATVMLIEDPRIPLGTVSNTPNYTGIVALVYGREQFTDVTGSTWSYTVEYSLLDQFNNTTRTGSLTLSNDNAEGVYEQTGIHEDIHGTLRLKVTGTSSTGTVPNDIRLELRLRTGYHQEQNPTVTPTVLIHEGSTGHPDLKNDQVMLCWQHQEGAHSYEIEWVFWDAQNTTSVPNNNILFKQAVSAETSNGYYVVDMIYPQGKVYFRVRAIGRHIQTANGEHVYRKYGQWSTVTDVTTGFETDRNWQFTRSFAEDGKHKEVINYFDNGLKSRQTLTTLSSDETTIIAEQLYDAESRPTLSILPVPVDHSPSTQTENPLSFGSSSALQNKLLYHPLGQVAYNRTNFDKTNATGPKADPLPAAHIAREYYSSSNPFIGTDNHIGYIPDAEGYPMAQVEYKNDGTGRVTRQSGVGDFHQIGSGQETEYLYATPDDTELRRMFGSNVGDSKHYRKNGVIDANGQMTISYIDQAGQTIATAMVGGTPENVQELDGSSKTITSNLMGSNNKSQVQRTSSVIHQHLNDQAGNVHTFKYKLTDGIILSKDDFCIDCTYEVAFSIQAADGTYVPLTVGGNFVPTTQLPNSQNPEQIIYTYSDLRTTCAGPTYAISDVVEFTATLNVGVYTIRKILTVTGPDLEDLNSEADNSDLLVDQDQFVQNYILNNIDSSACEPCSESYRRELAAQYVELRDDMSRDNIAFWPKVDTLLALHSDCSFFLDQLGLQMHYGEGRDCASMLDQMKRDLSPGGCLYENDFYAAAMDVNYQYHSGLPTTLTSKNGNVYNKYTINYLGLLRDPNEWRLEWIDTLVQTHPEYGRYTYCISDTALQSKLYDYELQKAKTLDEFLDNIGYTGGRNVPAASGVTNDDLAVLSAIIDNDPLFSLSLRARAWVMGGLGTYCTTMQGAYPAGQGPDCSNCAQPSVFCYIQRNFDPIPAPTNSPHTTPPSAGPTPLTDEAFWTMFRGIYMAEKQSVRYRYVRAVYPSGFFPSPCPQLFGEPQVTLSGGGTTGVTSLYSTNTISDAVNAMTVNTSDSSVTSMCDLMCEANATQWINALCPNLQYSTDSIAIRAYADLKAAFIAHCETGCGNYGTPLAPNQQGNPNPMGLLLKEDVDRALLNIANNTTTPTPLETALLIFQNNVAPIAGLCTDIMTTIGSNTTTITHSSNWYCGTNSYNDPRTTTVSVDKCQVMADLFSGLESSNLFPTAWTSSSSGNAYVGPVLYNNSHYPSGLANTFTGQLWQSGFNVTPNQSANYFGFNGNPGIITSTSFNNKFNYTTPIQSTSRLEDINRFIDFTGTFYTGGEKPCTFSSFSIEFWTVEGDPINPFEIVDIVANSYDCNDNSVRLHVADPSCRWTGQGAVGTACNNPVTKEIKGYVRLKFNGNCIPYWERSGNNTVRLCGGVTDVTIDQNQAQTQCLQLQVLALRNQAIDLYNNYRDSVLSTLVNDNCLDANESFVVTRTQTEKHYTLYYYDEAGNLIQTIPPNGVVLLNEATDFDAAGRWLGAEPPHKPKYFTRYEYNTLGQIVRQISPDGGETRFWYDYAQRLRLSQSARYTTGANSYGVGGQYAYTKYDRKGRTTEVGRLDNYTVNQLQINSENFPSNTGRPTYEVTYTEYDELGFVPTNFTTTLLNQRGRVVRTYNDHIATYYDYDIHGNVKTLHHQIKNFGAAEIKYDYDLITGNVNQVRFMEGTPQEFRHRYRYDADNRLTHTFTSQDGYIWERDARYFYYPHGPLMRCEKGEDNIQGEDFYYSLHGWIKGVNMANVDTDPGYDGNADLANVNRFFGKDQLAYSLGYYAGDYSPIAGNGQGIMNAGTAFNNDILNGSNTVEGLYNGNISYMVTRLPGLSQAGTSTTQGMVYQYDALHRIKQALSYGLDNSNTWQTSSNGQYTTSYTYDGNGNLQNLNRRAAGTQIDGLTYNYSDANGPNRLTRVEDGLGTVVGTDLGNQTGTNYQYDAIGNLISDQSENINQITWNIQNKIGTVTYNPALGRDNLAYTYAPDGNHLSKTAVRSNGLRTTTLYIRDASGNIMATFDVINVQQLNPGDPLIRPNIGEKYSRRLKEVALYGSSRLGLKKYAGLWDVYAPIEDDPSEMSEPIEAATPINWVATSTRGDKYFEHSNHLGNVLAVTSDKKLFDNGAYVAQVMSATDYYPFGWTMPGRSYQSADYRFGFNGMEKNPEINSGSYTTEFRQLDTRIARWLSIDPKPNRSVTPYALMENNPISFMDATGDTIVDHKGNPVMVSFDENNKPVYTFVAKYKEKQLERVKQRFLKETAPILESMSKTEMGRNDIMILNTIPTIFDIYEARGTSQRANSWFAYGEIMENGYFDKVTITPYVDNYKANNVKSDYDEWLGATMTVEVGHAEKDQIVLDREAKTNDPDYLSKPSGAEFQKAYTPLLNRATEYRIKYRQEMGQKIDIEVFRPLDKYGIKYNEVNKKAREALNSGID